MVAINIKEKVKESLSFFIKNQEILTSVDVCNRIKETGEWISNSSVAAELADFFESDPIFDGYEKKRQILKNNSGVEFNAVVYYPCDKSPLMAEYKESIDPDKFADIQLKLKISPVAAPKKVRKPRAKKVKDVVVAPSLTVSDDKDVTVIGKVDSVNNAVVDPVSKNVDLTKPKDFTRTGRKYNVFHFPPPIKKK